MYIIIPIIESVSLSTHFDTIMNMMLVVMEIYDTIYRKETSYLNFMENTTKWLWSIYPMQQNLQNYCGGM